MNGNSPAGDDAGHGSKPAMIGAEGLRDYFTALQTRLVTAVEAIEGSGGKRLRVDRWEKEAGAPLRGNGCTCIIEGGRIFERGGIAFSEVSGAALPASATAKRPELDPPKPILRRRRCGAADSGEVGATAGGEHLTLLIGRIALASSSILSPILLELPGSLGNVSCERFMSAARLILVSWLCFAFGAGNAWCACCALICADRTQPPATAAVEAPRSHCCGKAENESQPDQKAPCSSDPTDCDKCAQLMRNDSPALAPKPAGVDVSPISPFTAAEVFPSAVFLAAQAIRPTAAAHGTVSPGSTLLALRCALTL